MLGPVPGEHFVEMRLHASRTAVPGGAGTAEGRQKAETSITLREPLKLVAIEHVRFTSRSKEERNLRLSSGQMIEQHRTEGSYTSASRDKYGPPLWLPQ